jgi:lysophospholipase L1-like esterase
MEQLKHPLAFMHKFNLYKLSGLLIDDHDLPSIARVYGVAVEELEKIEEGFRRTIAQSAAALPAAGKAPADPAVSILAIGDSITSDRESYVKILNHYWRQDTSRQMLDSAISGDNTSDLIKRFYPTVVNQEFQWAVLFVGTNDSYQIDDPSRISVLSLEEYKRNIRFISETLLTRGKNLIQITIPPVDNTRLREFFPDANSLYTEEHIGEINEFIRQWAGEKGYPVADLARAVDQQSRDVLGPDGLHLNAVGQLLICRVLYDLLP